MATTELKNSKVSPTKVDADDAFLNASARVQELTESEIDPFLGTFEQERDVRKRITSKPLK